MATLPVSARFRNFASVPTIVLLVLAALALWGTARLTRRVAVDGPTAFQPSPQTAIGVVAGILVCGIWFGINLKTITTPLQPIPAYLDRTPGMDTEYGNSLKLSEKDYLQAEKLIPKTDRIFVAHQPTTIQDVTVWTYTRLAPRIPVETPREADWLIFFDGAQPTDPAYASIPSDKVIALQSFTLVHVKGRP